MNIVVLHFDSLASTNTEAIEQAKRGSDEGLCVIAREQTGGRGRHGRIWTSQKNAGLYFSIVLRPRIEARYTSLITLMSGIAVNDLLAGYDLTPDIKWVNDILIGEKKICGILAEAVETPSGQAVIVGIGLNVHFSDIPDQLANATSLDAEGIKVAFGQLEQDLVKYLSFWYARLCDDGGHALIIDEWRRRSSYFAGKPVRVTLTDSVFDGITDGLEETGALRVKLSDGSITTIHAGDVERLRTA